MDEDVEALYSFQRKRRSREPEEPDEDELTESVWGAVPQSSCPSDSVEVIEDSESSDVVLIVAETPKTTVSSRTRSRRAKPMAVSSSSRESARVKKLKYRIIVRVVDMCRACIAELDHVLQETEKVDEEDSGQETPPEQEVVVGTIRLHFQFGDKSEGRKVVRVPQTLRWKEILVKLNKSTQWNVDAFKVDGEKVSLDSTPQDYDLEDGDQVDVV
jgi:hypothetical protein